ncbi:DUF2089 family protein [Marinococcus sp. PL1-022]|uniref:DUF2089 family protein n=1 Tax=Marinococcus sp. PL1-022 TaxID=3095363 RepID=UPI0029C5DEF9|nr:DUF2089 family protein [Marinococcus sp. PL1-022]MDX6154474.1 DUF2089 family protein [Marinococcus sp. PL1-022]
MFSSRQIVWLKNLDNEDLEFIRRFVVSSGSLKKIAQEYEVSYPTVRVRLNNVIEKINSAKYEEEGLVALIKKLSVEDRLSLDDAKLLINKFREEDSDTQ